MKPAVVFTAFAEAGLLKALAGDLRGEAIKRSIADRAIFMVEQVARPCSAFPDRRMYVDKPSTGTLDLRVLIEVSDDQTTIWSVAAVDEHIADIDS